MPPQSVTSASRVLLLAPVVAVVVHLGFVPLPVMGDLLALTVTSSTSAPSGALDKAQADASSLLQKFANLEGSSYDVMAPGQTSTATIDSGNGAVRMLRGGEDEVEAVEDREAPGETSSRQLIIDCPNKCSNSGSIVCVVLGCAYCGRCRRHLAGTAASIQTTSRHRKVENQLSTELTARYCRNKSGCTLTATIQRVNADGTLTVAN